MARAQRGEVVLAVSVLTMAEVFYALRTSYKFPRPAAAELLSQLLLSDVLEIEQESILADALARIKAVNVDLGDAVLAAQAAASGDSVATFDRDFRRFPDVRCHQWG
jgi:predicted nucleic acid-binding protein